QQKSAFKGVGSGVSAVNRSPPHGTTNPRRARHSFIDEALSSSITRLGIELRKTIPKSAGVRAVYLFGSAAHSEEPDDVDLVIVYEKPLTPHSVSGIEPILQRRGCEELRSLAESQGGQSRHPPERVGHLWFVSLASPGGGRQGRESADREGAPDDNDRRKPSATRRKS